MQLTLKSRPMLRFRIQPLSLCQPRPQRGATAASPAIRANLNERPVWPGKGGKRTEPQREGGDDPVGGKPGQASPVKDPTGASQQGMGKSSTQFGPRCIDFQLNGSASVTPAELARIITGLADLTRLEQVVKVYGHNFDERHVSAAMTRVAKSERDNQVAMAQGMMQELGVLALPGLSKMDARCLSSVLWALGKVGGPVNPDLVQGILAYTKEELASFNPFDISNLLLGMANLQAPTDGIIHEIMDAGMRRLPEFKPQDLANTLWALATIGIPPDGPFIDGWLYFATSQLPGFGAQALANSLWALAKLGIKDEAFTASWFRVATRKLPEFNTQNLSNSLWAVSKLGIEDDAFTAAWLREAKVKLPGFNAQELSNSLMAVSKLGIKDEAFTAAWLRAAKLKLPEFETQDLSNSLMSAAKLGIEDGAFSVAWLSVATRKLPEFNAQELSNSLWAAAKLGIEDEAFIATWLVMAKRKLLQLNNIGVTQISAAILSSDSWAIATEFKAKIAAMLKKGE
eukprot:gene30052-biopygen15910